MNRKPIHLTEEQVRLAGVLLMLFFMVLVIAFLPAMVNRPKPEISHDLPTDLCLINGKPLTPELDYIGYGGPEQGLVLKYINQEGDLVLMVEDEVIGIYDGDFCR